MARYFRSAHFLGLTHQRLGRSVLAATLAGSVSLIGCAQLDMPQPNMKMNKTGLGAATGAAVGAVGGALVGSASGDAGKGLIIGSVTGAMAGGAIGHGLEQQDLAFREKRNVIESQSEQIRRQEEELRRLRSGVADEGRAARLGAPTGAVRLPAPEATLPPAAGMFGGSVQEESVLPQANSAFAPARSSNVQPTQSAKSVFQIPEKNRSSAHLRGSAQLYDHGMSDDPVEYRMASRAEARAEARSRLGAPLPEGGTRLINPGKTREEPVARVWTPEGAVPAAEVKQTQSNQAVEKVEQKAVKVASLPTSSLPPAQGSKKATTTETKRPEVTRSESETREVKKEAAPQAVEEPNSIPVVSVVQSKNVKQDLVPSDSNCLEGETEAERGRNATSDSDKIFYFRRAIRLCPKEPVYRIELGRVYSAIGRMEDARFEFTKALEFDPDNDTAQDELSMIMLQSQNNIY